MKNNISQGLPWLALITILVVSFCLRLYKIDSPIADWHSWRQADTASVAFEYTQPQMATLDKLLTPKYHDLSNIPSGQENPQGFRMVEFPIINYFVALVVTSLPQLNPTTDLVWVYRLVNTSLSVVTILVVFLLIKKITLKNNLALLTALIMAVMPYSIFYSRSILPEVALNFFNFASMLTFLFWLETQTKSLKNRALNLVVTLFWLASTWLLLALAFLIKPIAVFMAPAFAVLALSKLGFVKTFFNLQIWILTSSILPVLWWRTHIQQFPEGIPANRWLLNGNGIRLKPAWWRWLFGERIGLMMLGNWATGFAFLGLVGRIKSKASHKLNLFNLSLIDLVTFALTLGWLLYLVVFATGNVQHDYYQIPLIPVLSLLLARGIIIIYNLLIKNYSKFLVISILIIPLLLSLFLSWYQIKSFFNINNPAIVEAGKAVQTLTPRSAKVIAPYMGDTAFLFQTLRKGWPIGHEIQNRIQMGATHYVSTTYDEEARTLELQYQTLEKNNNFILIDLTTLKTVDD
jgi:hypothetical protein